MDSRNRQFSDDALTFDDMGAGSEQAFRPDLEESQVQDPPPDDGKTQTGDDKAGDRGKQTERQVQTDIDDAGHDTDDTGADDEPDTPEIQELAREMGWNPKGGKGGRNVSAREFIRTGHQIQQDLKKTLHNTRKDIKRLAKQVGDISSVSVQTKAAEIETKIATLESVFDAAIEDSDKVKAREIRKQITDLESSKPKAPTKGETAELEPDDEEAIAGWVKDHDWWNKDPDRTEIAGSLLDKIRTLHPDFTVQEALDALDEKMETLGISGKNTGGGNGNDDGGGEDDDPPRRSSRVGGGSTRGGNNTPRSTVTINDLSKFQQDTVKYNVKTGLYRTEADAIKAMVREGAVRPRR